MNKSTVLTIITVLTLSFAVNAQSNQEQLVKRKFSDLMASQLRGRALKLTVFSGDVNNDRITDYVISYCVQATDRDRDAGGGNALANLACIQEGIAVYIKTGNDYVLKANKSMDSFKSGNEISFKVKGIFNGKIICESTGYSRKDPRCCPSLVKKSFVTYVNGKLVKK